MQKVAHWVVLAVVAVGWSVAAEGKDVNRLNEWDQSVYDSLDHPQADSAATYRIRPGSEWATDVGRYRFDTGVLSFLRPVGGRPTGCYFKGRGRLDYEPPTPIERGQLFRFCRDSSLSVEFTELYICFFDSVLASTLRACGELATGVPLPRKGELRGWQERINDNLGTDLPSQGWIRLLRPPAPNSYLIITGQFEGQEPLYFQVNDDFEEAVTLSRRPNLLAGKGERETVCSYDRTRTREEAARREGLVNRGLSIARYNTDVTIKPSVEVVIDARMTVVPRRDQMQDIWLLVAPELEIDSVWINGDVVPFVYNDDAISLLARAPRPLQAGDNSTIRLLYRGKDLLYKFIWGDFFIKYTTSWLPVTSLLSRATYETSFRFPRHYDLVSSGALTQDTIEGDWRIKSWKTYDPAVFISFNYGSFDVLTTAMADGPTLHTYRSKNHLEGLFGGDMKKAVAADIEGSTRLFSQMFGPYPWPQLSATEIPGFHGQGFPQLLHLAWFSYESNREGITDHFRAHEVAHQWFGHLVGWKSYHDQWLSEGFAEYAGAMYVQARNSKSKTFLDLVKQWRSNILDVGGHDWWHAGPEVAPIWLGYRCGAPSSPASYAKLVYSKGAYVLHMLRNMLHDYKTGSDHQFLALMRDYVSTHSHREATTEDFRTVVERHLKQDMKWFFDQWVYGTQVPRFEYAWGRERAADGKWIIRGRITQTDVDTTFRSYMPISIVFEAGKRTFLQEVKGRQTTFVTPPVDLRPKEVIFDDYMTVLCHERVVEKP